MTEDTYCYIPSEESEKRYYGYLWETAVKSSTTSSDQELSGIAAVGFFQRSGIDKGFLKQIWSLSTPSATMNMNQFYTAVRCVTLVQNGEIPVNRGKSVPFIFLLFNVVIQIGCMLRVMSSMSSLNLKELNFPHHRRRLPILQYHLHH
jgi:hypothetical protein